MQPCTDRSDTLKLSDADLKSWRLDHGALEVICQAGRVWLTCEGDAVDHILRPGQRWRTAGRGTVVVQALGPARIGVCREEPPGTPGWWAKHVH